MGSVDLKSYSHLKKWKRNPRGIRGSRYGFWYWLLERRRTFSYGHGSKPSQIKCFINEHVGLDVFFLINSSRHHVFISKASSSSQKWNSQGNRFQRVFALLIVIIKSPPNLRRMSDNYYQLGKRFLEIIFLLSESMSGLPYLLMMTTNGLNELTLRSRHVIQYLKNQKRTRKSLKSEPPEE